MAHCFNQPERKAAATGHVLHDPTPLSASDSSPDASLWERWQWGWQSKRNALHWALRNFAHWAPGPYQETPAGQSALRGLSDEVIQGAETLLHQYGLETLPQRASAQRVLETLTYLHWLDRMRHSHPGFFQGLGPQPQAAGTSPEPRNQDSSGPYAPEHNHSHDPSDRPFRWLDVGAKNWAYVEALDAFIQQLLPNQTIIPEQTPQATSLIYQLDGVELDPHRRYTNLQTRAQAAHSFIQPLPQAAYHAGDIRAWRQPATVISLFLPFVFAEPHLAWGLPGDYFAPQALLAHVLHLLEPGGLLIIVNQGGVEAEAQARLFDQACALYPEHPLQIETLGQLDAPFIEYRYPRMGWLCRKPAQAP